ncbi:hypothetical protein KKB64_01280 [Patescibacteria group bacterium]|nr:hypothetical protein [Patescibacteria group bacterium]MBU1472407.1 hypothetical protein [Patescibacteria group bacterium]MBU2460055.1 hypothetical protein [Patescibacteria group bacterium]MBU2544785.1 hypothetical protein [Patescibacteria group bacterium]
MKRLVVIDGNAILHRSFHALPPLTAPDGSVVNAVYGFATTLLKIINDFQPTHVAVAFDRPAPTFRKKMFKEYQAKRPKMDENLIPQVDIVHELLRAFGIATYELDGFEADDVIGTIASKSKVKSKKSKVNIDQVIIVTGDRDILQLVCDDKVLVFMPTKGLSEGKLYGEKEVEERMGVVPQLIPDLKALTGDQSDNYPGIPGVGPKTAIELLRTFGSVENLYHRGARGDWGDMGEALMRKIQAGKESAVMSKKLAIIRTDVPIDILIEQARLMPLNTPAAAEILERLGFRSVLKRLEYAGINKAVEDKTGNVNKKEQISQQQELFG